MKSSISHLRIEGFRSLAHVELSLGDLNVLIGANGSGKSNFLSLFRFLNALTESRLQAHIGREGGASSILFYGPKRTERMSFGVRFSAVSGSHDYSSILEHVPPDTLRFDDERVQLIPVQGVTTGAAAGGNSETELKSMAANDAFAGEMARGLLQQLERTRSYHFHDTSAAAPVKQTGDLHDNRSLRGDAANLAAFLYMLRHSHPGHYDQIRQTVRLAFPLFDDFVLEPSRLNDKKILLTWRESGNDYEFGPHQLSDGTLRFICLATLLLQPMTHPSAPLLIAIDEPELGLHPAAIVLLASMLKEASRQVQVVVSTQSAALLGSIDQVDSVLVVERTPLGASTIRPLSPEAVAPWLEEYTLGDVWEKGVIGGRP